MWLVGVEKLSNFHLGMVSSDNRAPAKPNFLVTQGTDKGAQTKFLFAPWADYSVVQCPKARGPHQVSVVRRFVLEHDASFTMHASSLVIVHCIVVRSNRGFLRGARRFPCFLSPQWLNFTVDI